MEQQKKSSLKKSKPNYVNSIVGVALVLLLMGIMGWVFLNFERAGNALKEDIKVQVFLRTANKDSISQMQQYISSQPFAKNVDYIDKEKAKQIWNKDNNEDWAKILDANPLPESIDFYARAAYVNKDSLDAISTHIIDLFGNQITEIKYPKDLVNNINDKATRFGLAFLVISCILCVIVIFSIDNTIKLAMFSNRFLIKTMQMVGATRSFIARPMDIKAIINGLISAGIAIALLFIIISWIENQVPQLKVIHDNQLNFILFGGMILVGVGISLFSTHRSVIKYLKMKLDDLY
ncbi:permease-like cell division protein FtsX [Hydrotalea sp.]|uniref:cell division protein FtsX n=1 Tax=Hydrotalea sp. TaxID=2881279 RepID=UPI002625C709|nr:permease-like cell division protein FtsX [Hydrotalea sp.]